jgi:hypothetical protein
LVEERTFEKRPVEGPVDLRSESSVGGMEGVPSELRCGSPVLGQDRNTREQSPFEKRTRVPPKYPSKAKASEPQEKATEEERGTKLRRKLRAEP